MTFHFNQISLQIDAKRQASNDLIGIYLREADQAAQKFDMLYHNNVHSLSELADRAEGCFYQSIQDAIQLAVKQLVDRGIYDIDGAIFLNNYVDTSAWDDVFNKLVDAYLDIVATEEEKDAYRTARRQNRSRFYGAGFGIGGAVTGAAKAGAMNMATGAAHMVFNGIGKLGSTIAASAKCASIFGDTRTFNNLQAAVQITVRNLSKGYAQCLANHGDASLLEGFPTGVGIQKADTIMNNVMKIPADSAQAAEMVQQVFAFDPYNSRLYRYLIDYHRNAIDEIRRMAEILHKTDIVEQYCDQILRSAIDGYDLSTEENAKKSKAAYEMLLQQLQAQDSPRFLPELDKRLQWFDKMARTFEGVEYTTRTECAKAREEAQWIDALLVNMKDQLLEALKANRDRITSKCTVQQVLEKRLKKLDKQIEKKDRQERTVDGIEHENIESAAQAKDEAELIHTELENAKDLTLDELKQKRAKIAGQCTSDLAKRYLEKLDVAIAQKEKKKGKKIRKGYLNFRTPKLYHPHPIRNAILVILAFGIFFYWVGSDKEPSDYSGAENAVKIQADDMEELDGKIPYHNMIGTFYSSDNQWVQIELTTAFEDDSVYLESVYIVADGESRLEVTDPVLMNMDMDMELYKGESVVQNDVGDPFYISVFANPNRTDGTINCAITDERKNSVYSQRLYNTDALQELQAAQDAYQQAQEAAAAQIAEKMEGNWYVLNAFAPDVDLRLQTVADGSTLWLKDFTVKATTGEGFFELSEPIALSALEADPTTQEGEIAIDSSVILYYNEEQEDYLQIRLSSGQDPFSFFYRGNRFQLEGTFECRRDLIAK